jgi:hypothetical protein
MEYKQFKIASFERKPGKWRATVQRRSGRPLIATGRYTLQQFITVSDNASPADAMVTAMAAIDSGTFSRDTVRSVERYWRRTMRRETISKTTERPKRLDRR